MPNPDSLKELYADEMKDLWSANDQMARAVRTMAGRAHDSELRKTLEASVAGIAKHADTLKALLGEAGAEVAKEPCQGMEGLVREALKHTGEEAPADGYLLSVEIIAQYQRMSHYGIAGFGTAASYAGTLKLKDAQKQLRQATKEIYGGDEYMNKLAETTVNIDAEDE